MKCQTHKKFSFSSWKRCRVSSPSNTTVFINYISYTTTRLKHSLNLLATHWTHQIRQSHSPMLYNGGEHQTGFYHTYNNGMNNKHTIYFLTHLYLIHKTVIQLIQYIFLMKHHSPQQFSLSAGMNVNDSSWTSSLYVKIWAESAGRVWLKGHTWKKV